MTSPSDSALRRTAAAFFDEFVDAFGSFDGDVIARRYLAPYSALHTDGSIEFHATPLDIGKYFQKIVGGYHAMGCRSCHYKDLEATEVGPACVLATVTWELCRADGSVLRSWRESYNIAQTEKGLRIFVSMNH